MKPQYILSLIALLAAVAATTARAAPPQVRVATFAGDRVAAISYTFDDGLRDQYISAVPMLAEVGFKGTFFVIPGKISASVEDAERRKNDKRAWGTITWPELKIIADQGHEIGSHTWSHTKLLNLTADQVTDELSSSFEAIRAHLGRAPLTLAFPFNASNPEIKAAALTRYIATRNSQVGFGGERSTVQSLNAWADRQIVDRAWGVAMIHGIGVGYDAFTDPSIFREHLRHVKNRAAEIWVDTFANVARYVRERDDATLTLLSATPGRVVCTLAGSLDPETYCVPLTIVLDVPQAKSAQATRAGHELPLRITASSILVDAVPASGPITVTWKLW